jgi:hypothetical protein
MLCLDELYLLLLLNGKTVKSNLTLFEALTTEELKEYTYFTFRGLSTKDGKIRQLKDKFNLELQDNNKTIINSLKDIRDCLTHGNGLVQEKYGSPAKDKQRSFSWKTMDIFVEGVVSKKKSKIQFGKALKEESNICLRIKKHSKNFRIVEQISFTPAETYEIAMSLQFIAKDYLKSIKKNPDFHKKAS